MGGERRKHRGKVHDQKRPSIGTRVKRKQNDNRKPDHPADRQKDLMRGHQLRAFACSALLRAAGEPENDDLRVGWNQTLIQLLDSLRAIGPELYGPAAAFLAWLIPRVQNEGDTEELGFFMIGLLWLALHMRASDEVIIGLSESAVAAAERQIQLNSGRWSDRWLLGTTTYDLRHASWENLGLSLTQMNVDHHSPLARDWIKLIGHELGGK